MVMSSCKNNCIGFCFCFYPNMEFKREIRIIKTMLD